LQAIRTVVLPVKQVPPKTHPTSDYYWSER
jgi:hypothetical protein